MNDYSSMDDLVFYLKNRIAELNNEEPYDPYDWARIKGNIGAFREILGWIIDD